MKRAARYIIFYAALLGLWTILAKLKIWPPYLFPTPWGVAEALYAGFQDHSYLIAIRISMQRVLIGYGISVVLGMILGLSAAFMLESWDEKINTPWQVNSVLGLPLLGSMSTFSTRGTQGRGARP